MFSSILYNYSIIAITLYITLTQYWLNSAFLYSMIFKNYTTLFSYSHRSLYCLVCIPKKPSFSCPAGDLPTTLQRFCYTGCSNGDKKPACCWVPNAADRQQQRSLDFWTLKKSQRCFQRSLRQHAKFLHGFFVHSLTARLNKPRKPNRKFYS